MSAKPSTVAEDEERLSYLFESGLSDEKKYQRLLDAAWSLNNKGYSDYMAWENGFDNKKDMWQLNRKNKEAIKRLLVYYGSYIDFYEGDRDENDLPHGRGTIKYHQTGEKYDGNFLHGVRSGYGELYDANGRKVYDGMWLNDRFNGNGTLYAEGGSITEGTWVKGKLCGTFSVIMCDGGNISGSVDENGNADGANVCYYPNGDTLSCSFAFVGDTFIPHGKGEYCFFDGSTLSGNWNDAGNRDGKFVFRKTNGLVMEYIYRDGKLITRKKIRY